MRKLWRRFKKRIREWVRPPCRECELQWFQRPRHHEVQCGYWGCRYRMLVESPQSFQCIRCTRWNIQGMRLLQKESYLDQWVYPGDELSTVGPVIERQLTEDWWYTVRERRLRVIEPPEVVQQGYYWRVVGMVL